MVVAFCCFLLMFCNVGLASTSFNVYQPYIVALPGIGDSAGSVIIGVRTFFSLLCMFAVVRFYQLLDCRVGSFIASLFTTASMVVYGLAASFPLFCVAAALGGIGYGLGGMVCTTYLINRWFKTDVGTAVGVSAVGSGVASIVIPACAEWAIHAFSLQASFWLEALLALAIGLLTFALLRNRPEDLGLEPYVNPKWLARHQDDVVHVEGREDVPVDHGVHLPPHARTLFVVACVFVGAVSVSAPTFLSVLLVSEGYDHQFAALMLSASGLVLTFGKAAMGRLFDLLGSVRGTIISFAAFMAGLGLLVMGSSGEAALVWAGVVIYAFGLAIGSTGIPIWSLGLSTPEERVRVVRTFQTGYAAGGFAFAFVPGVMKDLVGTYVFSYLLMIVLLAAALSIILAVYRRYRAA
jgi:MFS family permease